jgi:hypothetical protein
VRGFPKRAGSSRMEQDESSEPVTDAVMGYTLPYILVILCIGLGVFFVVHSSRRRDRAKPEAYGQPK